MSQITDNRGKRYTSKVMSHQDDVMSEAKTPSVWQGYVLLFILIAIAYVVVFHILPYVKP